MDDGGVQDLRALDRDVARAARAYAQWRAALAAGDQERASDDPFDGPLRRASAKSTWDALGELSPIASEEPLRAALRRWVLALVNARIGLADGVVWQREATSARGRVEGLPSRRVAAALPATTGGPGGAVSWRDAWRGVVAAETPGEARLWLGAVAENARALAPLRKRTEGRREEIARRMGLANAWDQRVPAPPGPLRASAEQLLARTDDLSRAVWAEALRDGAGPAAVLHGAVARDAGDGWPARLSHRWLEEIFGAGVRGLSLDLPPAPRTLGAASFARAMASFGYAFRVAAAPAAMPFALAHEPWFVDAHRLGYVFGGLAADPEFHQRVLGLGSRRAGAQARVLARTALLDARLAAVRLLLRPDAGGDAFDEAAVRLFGAPIDGRLRGAWPAAREDEPARWLGLLGAPARVRSLRDEFDVDWFRNPRAWAELRARARCRRTSP